MIKDCYLECCDSMLYTIEATSHHSLLLVLLPWQGRINKLTWPQLVRWISEGLLERMKKCVLFKKIGKVRSDWAASLLTVELLGPVWESQCKRNWAPVSQTACSPENKLVLRQCFVISVFSIYSSFHMSSPAEVCLHSMKTVQKLCNQGFSQSYLGPYEIRFIFS